MSAQVQMKETGADMIEFTIKVAGRVARVNAIFDSTREYCADYLCDAEPEIALRITAEDIRFEREKSRLERRTEGLPPLEFSDAHLEITAVQRQLAEWLLANDTLLFHGSVVAMDGAAYLFTAISGTGKSTHTRLWREVFGDQVTMINDDKPFLLIKEDGITAFGSPWNGKHRLGSNASAPLRAICILERGEVNRICPISGKDAVKILLQQSNRPRTPQLLPTYLNLLDRLAAGVRFYRLQCNMDPQAALVAYEGMSRSGKDGEQ